MDSNGRGEFNLIFDADDTLWDSNIHFRDAEREFAEALCDNGAAVDAPAVRATVQRFELEIIGIHGYGRRPYVLALHRALTFLAPAASVEKLGLIVAEIGERFAARNCDLLPGVRDTLEVLAARHKLLLFTKGQPEEQLLKLERSGLGAFFWRVEVPAEKDAAAYSRLIASATLAPEITYMIGNSPRSDINPALRAGLGAVFIPHPHTWEREHEEIQIRERLIELENFSQLKEVF
ncbi:MAG: HAD family hydrolase [Candidatus Binataceae bacterium]